jgi:hypothetical protein
VKAFTVKGCEGAFKITHPCPLNLGTSATVFTYQCASILDTREDWALGAPASFVVEAQVRGQWVRVAEGTWSTQVTEEDFDGMAMKDKYKDFTSHYKVGRPSYL